MEPVDAAILDDEEPLLSSYGWGFKGYNLPNISNAEDEDERGILSLALGSRVYL